MYGVPVHALQGGPVRDTVRVYAWVSGDEPAELADHIAAQVGAGFTAVKTNGPTCSTRRRSASPTATPTAPPLPGLGITVDESAVRQADAFGDGVAQPGVARRPDGGFAEW